MREEGVERRLTTILAADVVGYSRLMEPDEVGTLTVLKAHRRELIDSAITKHRDRIIRQMGDGALVEFTSVLVEFTSVVDVVTCTVGPGWKFHAQQSQAQPLGGETKPVRRIQHVDVASASQQECFKIHLTHQSNIETGVH